MNNDERRKELLDKANSLIDTISESMRMVENVESAKKKFLRADSELALHLPIEGCGGMTDMFKMNEIFDEKGIEKIKAYILTQLEFLEEESLKILETAGFHSATQYAPVQCAEPMPKPFEDWDMLEAVPEQKEEPIEIPFSPEEDAEPDPVPEDDSDMIVVPEKLEKKIGKPRIGEEKVQQMKELLAEGKNPLQISKELGVSHQSVYRHLAKTQQEPSGRSASRRQAVR